MTTQPSDWDVIALEVARRFTQDTEPQRRANLQVAVIDAIKRARELEASGGGHGVPPEMVGSFVEKAAQIISGAPFPSGRSLYKARCISDLALSMYATPRTAEAATTNSAQISSEVVVGDTELLNWLATHLADAHGIYQDANGDPVSFDYDIDLDDDLRGAIRAAMGAVGAGGGE